MSNPVELMCEKIKSLDPNYYNWDTDDLDSWASKTFRLQLPAYNFKVGDAVVYSYYWHDDGVKHTCVVKSIDNGWVTDTTMGCSSASFRIANVIIWEVYKPRSKK